MKPVILTLLLVVLPYQLTTTKAFIDCRTACRKCKEGLEDVNLLEIYCSMCKECRDRRRERMGQQKMPPGLGRPGPGGPRPGLEDFRSGPEGFQSRPEGFRPGAQRFHSGPGGFRPGPQGFRPGPENLRPEGRGASGFNRQSSLRTKTFYRSPNAIRMDSMNQAAAVEVNRMETRGKRNAEADFANDLMFSELQTMRNEQRQWKVSQTIARGMYVPTRQRKPSQKPFQSIAGGMYVPTRRPKVWSRKPLVARRVEHEEALMATWPEHCPTPPICEEEEPIELLTKTRSMPTPTTTTTTIMTTTTTTEPPTTTEPATCPPIITCRKKKMTTTGCIPCMPMCPAPCPAGPLIPSEIVVNINWNGKVPFEFLPTAAEHEELKFTKTKITEPTTNDWIQNDYTTTEEPTTTSTTTTTTTSTTTTTTTPTETVPITQTPFTIVETSPPIPAAIIPTVCPPQPHSSSNPCCYLPLAFQGQLNMLGINCDPQKQGLVFTTTMNPVTVATIPPFVLDEALIRKILINSNQNNNGNEHSVVGNNILSPEHGIMVESTNINENNNVNEKGNHIKGREVLSFGQNNGVYDFNHKHGPSNSEFTDFQRKIVMNENPYNDKSINRKIVINDRNGNGGSSNNAYDVQKQKVINKPNNNLKKQIAINQFNPDIDRKIEINADKNKDKQNAMNEGGDKQTSQAPCDKKTTNNQDQDYYYVYVGLPKNLAGSRRASTPVDLPVLDFPPPGVF